MQLALYRSKVHATYPDEAIWYCYAFEPIPAAERDRDGRLMSWTDDSGLDPFAMIEVPDGSEIIQEQDIWLLHVPGRLSAIEADEVYDLAMDESFGLSVIWEPSIDGQRYKR